MGRKWTKMEWVESCHKQMQLIARVSRKLRTAFRPSEWLSLLTLLKKSNLPFSVAIARKLLTNSCTCRKCRLSSGKGQDLASPMKGLVENPMSDVHSSYVVHCSSQAKMTQSRYAGVGVGIEERGKGKERGLKGRRQEQGRKAIQRSLDSWLLSSSDNGKIRRVSDRIGHQTRGSHVASWSIPPIANANPFT